VVLHVDADKGADLGCLAEDAATVSRQRSRSMSRPIWVSFRLVALEAARGQRLERLLVPAGGGAQASAESIDSPRTSTVVR